MRTVIAITVISALGCDGSNPSLIEDDQACVRANAMFASWPNGVGYCSGNTFVACEGSTGMPMDCGALACVQAAVPRTILVGCHRDEADPVCAASPSGIWKTCDGPDELICLDQRLFARHTGGCPAPVR
ncbi:MAG: hypothetical protein JNL83_32345 [Myxococcales bacterium]|nr:hypothetical protein [Myxococcales bacterium]